MCEEKPFSQLDSTVPPGSPPRMRGKDKWAVSVEDAGRITPAHAGKSGEVLTGLYGK